MAECLKEEILDLISSSKPLPKVLPETAEISDIPKTCKVGGCSYSCNLEYVTVRGRVLGFTITKESGSCLNG